MANQSITAKDKAKMFVKKYGYLILTITGVIAFVITIIALATSNSNKVTKPVSSSKVLTFNLPLAEATIGKGYSDKRLQYNATLNQWEVHKGIDFSAPVGSQVSCVAAGKVTEVYHDYLEGTVVVVAHANNLYSKYGSLDEDVLVKVGDTLSGGQAIGTVAKSANAELSENAHLHFEMLENDKKVDPAGYLNLGGK